VGADQSQIGSRILPDQAGFGAVPVGQEYLDSGGAVYHMAVGQDVAVGVIATPEPLPGNSPPGPGRFSQHRC